MINFFIWFFKDFLFTLKKKKKKKIIELGHQGAPVQDVILRIYRQTERDDEKRAKRIVEGDGEKRKVAVEREKIVHNYSARLTLVDDCDEVLFCLFVFLFCFVLFHHFHQFDSNVR